MGPLSNTCPAEEEGGEEAQLVGVEGCKCWDAQLWWERKGGLREDSALPSWTLLCPAQKVAMESPLPKTSPLMQSSPPQSPDSCWGGEKNPQ